MIEPSAQPPSPPAEPPLGSAPVGARTLRLLDDVRALQRRALWVQGLWYSAAAGAVLALGGVLWAKVAVLVLAALVALAVLVVFGVVLVRRQVGDDERTARLLSERAPSLNFDLLAAVELSRALGTRADFSPELARAFVRAVDTRAGREDARALISTTPRKRAATAALLVLAATGAVATWQSKRVKAGLRVLTASTPKVALRREPITGDFELTYRYPAYTGLEQRTVSGTSGDLAGPTGTEVVIKTRADRDVDAANLMVGGQASPLQVKGRELTGSVVLEKSGVYHVAFLDGRKVVAEGPDLPIVVQADAAPEVRLVAPLDVVELNPEQQTVTLKYEASDDFGLDSLELVYAPRGGAGPSGRISLKPDDGRTTRGQYVWNVGALGLKPGGAVSYFVEAKDNDAVSGPKKGVSKTQVISLYSAAEHRLEALRKTQQLWERLVGYLADRLEAKERLAPPSVDAVAQGQWVDERGTALSAEFHNLALELSKEREPFEEIISVLLNVGGELNHDLSTLVVHRRMYLRLAGYDEASRRASVKDPTYLRAVSARLNENLTRDREHAEKNVLYLESLIDRVKLDSMKELARELKTDRRELTKLLEEYRNTKDSAVQQRVLEQMAALKRHMMELQERMAEMAKGIRDDFMNREALEEMMESQNLDSKLDEIEKLVREGNADDAVKKMQELAMEMDEQLEQLEKAADEADQQADPELAKKFQEFSENLAQTVEQQEALAEKTKSLRDKYREQAKEHVAKQGAALKDELKSKLKDLRASFDRLENSRLASRLDDNRLQALHDVSNVKQALDANDFDLAAEAADKLREHTKRMADTAAEQKRMDDLLQNSAEARRDSRQLNEQLGRDVAKADDIAESLKNLFPQRGSMMSEADRQQVGDFAKQQKQLEQRAEQLQQQMNELGERAPIFDEEAQEQLKQAGQRMGSAGQRLSERDASHGYGEQQGALQSLKGLQKQMQKSGRGKGLPMPLNSSGGGRGQSDSQKVEIPDEDPNRAPREFRKDVMDAMKQGAPDRYRDQNKRYYEELVK